MFGLGFGELCIIIMVAVIVIGPRDLPKVMRKAGQWAGKLRRMAAEARAASGIDDILKDSTIGTDLHEIRKLARGELDNVVKTTIGSATQDAHKPATSATAHHRDDPYDSSDAAVTREREYPRDGADSYRALPDTALAYGNDFPASPLASDPLYAEGDVNAPPRKIAERERTAAAATSPAPEESKTEAAQ
ncbi:MAG: twin-arginine translocase TatA/TatE family subunit [Polyangiaceae bacterium]